MDPEMYEDYSADVGLAIKNNHSQACLRDIAGSVLDHHSKVNLEVK